MLDIIALILFIFKFNAYCIWEIELNKKQSSFNALKRFYPTWSRTSRIPPSDLIPIDHPLSDEGGHFSLSFSQTKTVLLSLGTHALKNWKSFDCKENLQWAHFASSPVVCYSWSQPNHLLCLLLLQCQWI